MKRLVCIILMVNCVVFASSAQTRNNRSTGASNTSDANQQSQPAVSGLSVDELDLQREKAFEEIELTTQLLAETNRNAKNSLNRLNLLSQQLLSRKRIIALMGEEIAVIDKDIRSIGAEIDLLTGILDVTKNNYAKSLQSQQLEFRTTQYKMLVILSTDNLTQSYRRMRYLREYADWQKEEADRIIQKQNEINERKTILEKSRAEKQRLLTERAKENKKIEEEERLQRNEVSDINKKQKQLQQQLQQQKKEADALLKQIERLIAEDIANYGKGQTDAASYVLEEKDVKLSNNFENNKGKLPAPINSRYTVIARFGEQQHQELSHVRTTNNGIDLQTVAGAEALSIFNGVVTRIFVMPGYNNNVIVRHGNYLTVYSNLSQVYVKAGDQVTTRQPLGKIYTDTQKGNETILHFQIWKEHTKLNPQAWIQR